MSSQTKLAALIFLVPSINFAFVSSQSFCGTNGNYTRNSTYEANLNSLFPSLSTNIVENGFYNASAGQNPDRVNIIVFCRGDAQLDFCRRCIRYAVVEIVSSCPNQKEAIFYSFFAGRPSCMLRYSNESIVGKLATDPGFSDHSVRNAPSPVEFAAELKSLLYSLQDQASTGCSLTKVAAGNRSTSGCLTIYGLVQCTPDLSRDDCNSCLVDADARLSRCCNVSIAARVLMPSCRIYYDISLFYNDTRLQELVAISSPPNHVP